MAVETLKPTLDVQAEQVWPLQGQWTYDDYCRLPDDGWRYEVIEGDLYMNPAPRPKHQEAILNLATAMSQFVRNHRLGKVYAAPIDVILPGLASPVQPDLLFIAAGRLDMVKENLIEGAPDLIVEVLSPTNWLDDRRVKFRVYALAGVREYWMVDVDRRQIEAFRLEGGSYTQAGRYAAGEQVPSTAIGGFDIAVDEVCPA
ncbi:MAG: Uma2 family endonuclease [Chloroflexota bacterium]